MYKGRDGKTGYSVYESNTPKGTTADVRRAHVQNVVQNILSKSPIVLEVRSANGVLRRIEVRFNPEYEAGEVSDLGKLMARPKGVSHKRHRAVLDLVGDWPQIIKEAAYHSSEPERGINDSKTHEGVKEWYYFVNDILFRDKDETETTLYRITINIKARSDGCFVYSIVAGDVKNKVGHQTV